MKMMNPNCVGLDLGHLLAGVRTLSSHALADFQTDNLKRAVTLVRGRVKIMLKAAVCRHVITRTTFNGKEVSSIDENSVKITPPPPERMQAYDGMHVLRKMLNRGKVVQNGLVG
jgi:hypothetical protein